MMVDSSFSRLSLTRPESLKKLEIFEEKTQWSSETDLHHLPPLSPVPKSPSTSSKDQFHRLYNPRPPTPIPNKRSGNYFTVGKPRTGPLSPCNSINKLSLNLDLSPLKEASASLDRLKKDKSFDKADIMDSPRLCVRSLPTSPVLSRPSKQRKPMRRYNSDSEQHNEFSKEDRIIQWIQEVQQNRQENNLYNDVEDYTEFSSTASTSDSSELELGSSPSLPAIQENSIFTPRASLS